MKRGRVAAFGRLARTVFPLSLRGLLMLLLSVALLIAGASRADLAALFWGASFLLFTVYALVAGHILRFALARRRAAAPDFLSLILPAAGLSSGQETEADVAARLPRSFPPGFSVRLSLPLAWHDRRIDSVSVRLPAGGSRKRVTFTAPHRGTYTSAAALLEARDVLGFTDHRLTVPQHESMTVHPAVLPAGELSPMVEQADEAVVYARKRRRSESLLEARKYFPGDDVRRLNWKVFAHLNELFLRVGEEVPPPESRILFVLDTTSNPLVPRQSAADYLDTLVESCLAPMAALMARGIDVMLSLPGEAGCRSYSGETLTALLATLSDAWWTDSPWAPELPMRPLHVAVFSSPGSPGLPRIMSTVQARGWSASLFVKGLGPEPPARTHRVKDMLFLPRAPAQKTSPIGRRERTAFADALARDLASYRGYAGKAWHAAEI